MAIARPPEGGVQSDGSESTGSSGSSGSSEASDSEDDLRDGDGRACCCCCCCCPSPEVLLALGFSAASVAGFSVAVHYGLVRKPDTSEMFSLDAWREWPTKLRVEAGFRQYDRDKDGVFGPADVAEIALTLKGERPTPRQAAAWVARGDLDGDGTLNFTEFWSMTRKERAAKGEG